jgi:hypothetical protein
MVRSQSTGVEGFAEVGSVNAIKFSDTPDGTIWVHYRRKSQAIGIGGTPTGYTGTLRYRIIDLVADAVPGQPFTYYIDKGATPYGYNVQLDGEGFPDIRVMGNGREKLLVDEATLDTPGVPGDCAVVRSLSTGGEGFSVLGSRNAIRFLATPDETLWIHYRRDSLAEGVPS